MTTVSGSSGILRLLGALYHIHFNISLTSPHPIHSSHDLRWRCFAQGLYSTLIILIKWKFKLRDPLTPTLSLAKPSLAFPPVNGSSLQNDSLQNQMRLMGFRLHNYFRKKKGVKNAIPVTGRGDL
jgi:hypothetical protein